MKKTGQNENRSGGRTKLLAVLICLILLIAGAGAVRMSRDLLAQPASSSSASTALQQDQQRQEQPTVQMLPKDQVPVPVQKKT